MAGSFPSTAAPCWPEAHPDFSSEILKSPAMSLIRQRTLAGAQENRGFVASDHVAIARAIVAGSHQRAFELMAERIVATLEVDGLDRDLVVEWR